LGENGRFGGAGVTEKTGDEATENVRHHEEEMESVLCASEVTESVLRASQVTESVRHASQEVTGHHDEAAKGNVHRALEETQTDDEEMKTASSEQETATDASQAKETSSSRVPFP
jgi:hypothetical protein